MLGLRVQSEGIEVSRVPYLMGFIIEEGRQAVSEKSHNRSIGVGSSIKDSPAMCNRNMSLKSSIKVSLVQNMSLRAPRPERQELDFSSCTF